MSDENLTALLLHRSVEAFLHEEADLLDERRFEDWLALCCDDIRYWMPLVRNVQYGKTEMQFTREQMDTAWIDEGKETLRQRVQQLKTGIHWAEEPQSRVSHLITNIRILEATPSPADAQEVLVKSRFLVYRNRLEDEVDFYIGKRKDRLRRDGASWKIARREIYLDQNVLLAKNITTFF